MKQNGMICKTLLLVAMMGFSLMSNAQRYETDHGRVYFGEEMLMQADAHSFVDLGCGYAKDRHHVYMNDITATRSSTRCPQALKSWVAAMPRTTLTCSTMVRR